MNAPFDPAALLSKAGAGNASSADQIREQLENNRVGCGCLGAVALFLVGAWFAIGALFNAQSASMVGITLAAIIACAAISLRGHHFWTGLSLLSLTVAGLGVFPVALSLLDPASPAFQQLPAWLQPSQAGPFVLAAIGLVTLGGNLVQMRKAISTPESVYAIQLHAASKQTVIPTVQPQLETAHAVLKAHAHLGLFPIHAEYLTFGDRQSPPKRYSGQSLMGLLAVRCKPSKDGAQTEFAKTPWVRIPSDLTASMPNLGPESVGVLIADADHMRYLPIRTSVEELHIPWTAFTRYTLRVNALELEYALDGEDPKTLAFLCTHAWRFASLGAFLRVFDASIDDENSALWVRSVRDGMHSKATQALTDHPKASRLRARIEGLRTRLDSTLHPNLDALEKYIDSPYPTWRALIAPSIDILDKMTPTNHATPTSTGFFLPPPSDIERRLALLEEQLTLLPSEVWPDALSELAEDLQSIDLLHKEAWPMLIDTVAGWSPRALEWAFEREDEERAQLPSKDDTPEEDDATSREDEDTPETALILANTSHDEDEEHEEGETHATQLLEDSQDAFIEMIELVRDLSKASGTRKTNAKEVDDLYAEAAQAFPNSLLLFELRTRAHTKTS